MACIWVRGHSRSLNLKMASFEIIYHFLLVCDCKYTCYVFVHYTFELFNVKKVVTFRGHSRSFIGNTIRYIASLVNQRNTKRSIVTHSYPVHSFTGFTAMRYKSTFYFLIYLLYLRNDTRYGYSCIGTYTPCISPY